MDATDDSKVGNSSGVAKNKKTDQRKECLKQLLKLKKENDIITKKIQYVRQENFERRLKLNSTKLLFKKAIQASAVTLPLLETPSTAETLNGPETGATNGNANDLGQATALVNGEPGPSTSTQNPVSFRNDYSGPSTTFEAASSPTFVTKRIKGRNQTHIAAPRRVNGHELINPIINLLRVSTKK